MEQLVHEESLPSGLRYTEKARSERGRRDERICELWAEGVTGPVCRCGLLSFRQRIGSVVVASEGVCGVCTPPQHRRKGYVGQLFAMAIGRAEQRVSIVYLYAGVRDLYHKYGFAPCFADCELRLHVRDGERVTRPAGVALRPITKEDYPAACDIYNREHGSRSWTHAREPAHWRGPEPVSDWGAGQDGLIAEQKRQAVGFALFDGVRYGTTAWRLAVEACAANAEAADAIIAEGVERAGRERRESLTFLEPPDSALARALRRAGCEEVVRVTPRSEGMARILGRKALVETLAPELARRAGGGHTTAVQALAEGRLVPDNGMLLQLLTGFRSWRDAADVGFAFPREYEAACRAWFPGWSESLPTAFTHHSDRY